MNSNYKLTADSNLVLTLDISEMLKVLEFGRVILRAASLPAI